MIETFRSRRDRQFYFAIKARNGKIIAQSEGYKSRRSRDRGAASLCRTMRGVVRIVERAK